MGSPNSSLPSVGSVVAGKYRLTRQLGEGGMGVVMAARHEELAELFALKFMTVTGRRDEERLRRFEREARASAKLRGEHVARVFDVGRLEDGTPYMVMEHLEGEDLADHLGRAGPLPPAEAVHYVVQALHAIREAHHLGIIHRDLKPSNLFLTRRFDGSACIKVLDFGIAKTLLTDESDARTRTGAVFGSPAYMSPEQIRCTREVDARTDLWAMGAVLYELLTQRSAFDAETTTALLAQILEKEPAAPSQWVHLPEGLEPVLFKALAKDRDARYASADEMITALSPFDVPTATSSAHKLMDAPKKDPGLSSSTAPSLATAPTMAVSVEVATAETVLVTSGEGGEVKRTLSAHSTTMSPATTSDGSRPATRKGLLLPIAIAGVLSIAALTALAMRGRSDPEDAAVAASNVTTERAAEPQPTVNESVEVPSAPPSASVSGSPFAAESWSAPPPYVPPPRLSATPPSTPRTSRPSPGPGPTPTSTTHRDPFGDVRR